MSILSSLLHIWLARLMPPIQISVKKWEHKERVLKLIQFQFLTNYLYSILKLFLKGESSYVCWAYSCATMIRAECTRLIKYLFQNGKINEEKKKNCLEYINGEKIHKEIRNLIMMILLPKRLHFDGAHQAAFLRAAVSRVRKLIIILNLLFILDGKSNCNGARGIVFPSTSLYSVVLCPW